MRRFGRSAVAIAVAVAAVAIAAGWIFARRMSSSQPAYQATMAGNYEVSVRFEPGTASEAAARAAAEYVRDGWDELPSSAGNFRMFAKGRRAAAFLAEDVPEGARMTELRRR